MEKLTPMSRDAMRELKAKTDEEQRLRGVQQNISGIYNNALQAAKSSSMTKWSREIQAHEVFLVKNMDDILSGLQNLFPDCSIEFKSSIMAMGSDGAMHDVSTLDPVAMKFMRHTQAKQYITIEWS